jgi:16S rRNA (guanine527-N7)-methyltransferase
LPDNREVAEHNKVGAQVGAALQSYRSDPLLAPFLTEPFVQRMELFSATLALWGAVINLTSRPQDPAETAFHIVDSMMLLALRPPAFPSAEVALWQTFSPGKHILDFGSGAGFPGLILASACATHFTLAEARHRRASFLEVAAAEMGLDNVEILTRRLTITDLAPRFDAILSRASGPAPEFYEIAAGALRPGGLAILYATPSQRLDLAAAKKGGLSGCRRYRYSLRRGDAKVDRVLATWSMTGKSPLIAG